MGHSNGRSSIRPTRITSVARPRNAVPDKCYLCGRTGRGARWSRTAMPRAVTRLAPSAWVKTMQWPCLTWDRGLSMRRCSRGLLAPPSAPAKPRSSTCPSPRCDDVPTVTAWRAAARARSCSHPNHRSRQTYRTKHSSAWRQSLLPLVLSGRAKRPGRPRCSRS